MKLFTKSLFAATMVALAAQASAQITLYENDAFKGRTVTSQKRLASLDKNMDNRVSSVIVVGKRWQACEEPRFSGRCVVLRPGQYPTVTAMGLNNRISSARPLRADVHVAEADYAPMPLVAQDFRRGRNEQLYDAEVTSAKAVAGTPAQRCWMEKEQVAQPPAAKPGFTENMNYGGAAIGAVIGGILGHQVGGGSGKQIATVGGALGGAALGSQYGKKDVVVQPVTHDVRKCDSNAVQATPAYWDVSYTFRGVEHRVQMANQPGRTITVNRKGEPRA